VEKKEKKTDMLKSEVSVSSPGNPWISQSGRRQEAQLSPMDRAVRRVS